MKVRLKVKASTPGLRKLEAPLYKVLARELNTTIAEAAANAAVICPKLTGDLSRSIKVTRRATATSLKAELEPGMYYQGYVEYGTVKMAARPYIAPAMRAAQDVLVKRAEEAILRAGKL